MEKLHTTPKAYASPSSVMSPRVRMNGDDLQRDDGVDQPRGGAEPVMRMAEPVGQDAVFGDAIEHAVGTDDGGVDGAGQQQHAHQHHHAVKRQAQGERADQDTWKGRR